MNALSDPSRRDFLAGACGTALAAGGLASALQPKTLSAGTTSQVKKIGFALVGLGSLSTNQLAPAFAKTKHCRLAGIVTGTPAKEKKWADKYGISRENIYNYETFDQVAKNPNIDVIYVVLPNSMHAEYTIRAAEAGKHVLSEKPMANSAEDCRKMIAACKRAGRKLAVGYRCQFEPHHLQAIRFAREKTFGEMKFIDAGFGFRIGDPTQWRLKKSLAGGGAMMDVGIYALQACRYLAGQEPIAISAQETKTDAKKFAEVDETICWEMTFPSGLIASCSTTYAFSGMNNFSVYATEGNFGLGPAYGYGGIKGWTSRDDGPLAFGAVDHFAAEMDDFAQCILNDRPSKVPGEEGLRDLTVIEAIYQSIHTGKTVEIE